MITAARIQHFKSIFDTELKFNAINVIVGPNGSGKSNIIDAMSFLHDCIAEDVDNAVTKRHGIDSLRQWSRTRPYHVVIELSFVNEHGRGRYKIVLSSSRGAFKIEEEYCEWSGPTALGLRVGGHRESDIISGSFSRNSAGETRFNTDNEQFSQRINQERPRKIAPDQLCLQYAGARFLAQSFIFFRPVYNELISFSRYNIFPNTLRNPQLISREHRLEEDGSNLSSVLKRINSDKRFGEAKENIIESLRHILINIADIQVKSAGGYYVPVVRVREHSNEVHEFNLSQISDGTLRTLGLLTAFYQPLAPTKIGIEEPELMIHPGALQILKEAMDTYVSSVHSGGQVFVTTHSPSFIDLFDPRDILWARMQKGKTICDRIGKRQLDIVRKQLFSLGELLLAEGLS